MKDASTFRKGVEHAINACSAENGSDTPDFVLAGYLDDCMRAFDKTTRARDEWYGDRVHLKEPATV